MLPIGGMGVVATALPPIGGMLILAALPVLGPWLQDLGWLGLLLYLGSFIICAGLALLPTYSQAILGGWAFGLGWGLPAAMGGFAGGAWLAYGLGRSIAQDRLLHAIDSFPRWQAVHRELLHAGMWRTTLLVTLLRLPPTSPFALTNVLMASAHVPMRPYLIGTILGLTPRTALAVFTAAGVSQVDLDQSMASGSNWMIFFGIATALLVVLVIGVLANRALRRLTETDATGASMHSQAE
ncbi:MAG: VTT domain-containing protein [Phycisphaeraceae bacterium]